MSNEIKKPDRIHVYKITDHDGVFLILAVSFPDAIDEWKRLCEICDGDEDCEPCSVEMIDFQCEEITATPRALTVLNTEEANE